MLKKYFLSTLIIGIFLVPTFSIAQQVSSKLTSSQVSSILSLLASFGVDQAMINNVNSALTGVSVSVAPATAVSPVECLNLKYNLYLGLKDKGTEGDVTKLQKFLAKDKDVYPAGLITGYFGPMTDIAVKKWQVKNKVVSSGTPDTTGYGVVGPKTRARLAGLCNSAGKSVSVTPATQTPTITKVVAKASYGNRIYPNETAYVIGTGFSSNNIVQIGSYSIPVQSSDGKNLNFVVPAGLSGKQVIKVSNSSGLSTTWNVDVISSTVAQNPFISTIEYSSGIGLPTTFTVIGQNFTAGSKIKYTDLNAKGGVDGELTRMTYFSSTKMIFNANTYTGNTPSVYEIKITDSQGRVVSNAMRVDTRVVTQTPTITTIEYTPPSSGVAETFVVIGQNFTAGSKLQYLDLLAKGATDSVKGELTLKYNTPTKLTFSGNRYTGNSASVYEVKVVNPQGRVSNAMRIDTRQAPTPAVAFFTPSSGVAGSNVEFYGVNLSKITSIIFTNVNVKGGGDYTAQIGKGDDSKMTVTLPSNMPAGSYTVMFTPLGDPPRYISVSGAFIVKSPEVSTVTLGDIKDSYTLGESMYISWTPILPGVSTIKLVPLDGHVTSYGIYGMKVYGNPVNIKGSFTYQLPKFANTMKPGKYYLKLTPANGIPDVVSSVFTIQEIIPAITSINPNPLRLGEIATVYGSGFTSGSFLRFLYGKDHSPIYPTSFTDTSFTFNVPNPTPEGLIGTHTIQIVSDGWTAMSNEFSIISTRDI